MTQVDDADHRSGSIETIPDAVAKEPDQRRARDGNEERLERFVGQVMSASDRNAKPQSGTRCPNASAKSGPRRRVDTDPDHRIVLRQDAERRFRSSSIACVRRCRPRITCTDSGE
jgi:hypothetical protein